MHTSQARERLLAAAVDHALDTGIADLSLRQLAAAIGTSHRMLIYHFGSREGLLAAVTQAVEEQQRAAMLEPGTTGSHGPNDAQPCQPGHSTPAPGHDSYVRGCAGCTGPG